MCLVCQVCCTQNMFVRQLYSVLLKYPIIVDVMIHIRYIRKIDIFGKNEKIWFGSEKFTPISLMYQIWLRAWCVNIKVVSKMLPVVHEEYSCSILKL